MTGKDDGFTIRLRKEICVDVQWQACGLLGRQEGVEKPVLKWFRRDPKANAYFVTQTLLLQAVMLVRELESSALSVASQDMPPLLISRRSLPNDQCLALALASLE